MIKEKLWLKTIRTTVLAFFPMIPFFCGFNMSEQKQQLKCYQSDFGLDEESVSQIAQNLGISEQEIYSLMKPTDFIPLLKDDGTIGNVKKCVELILLDTGSLPPYAFPSIIIYFLHLKFIDTEVEDAKRILAKIEEMKPDRME
ncbi:hypothetical protein CapIbe_006788 [Capra ibex]